MGANGTIQIKSELRQTVRDNWDRCRVVFFSAPCGCGKTTAARALLEGRTVCAFSAADKTPLDARPVGNCDAVLVDDLQFLTEPERQSALCELIAGHPGQHFFLLSRGRVPGWVMPFRFAGVLLTVEAPQLFLDLTATQRFLQARGAAVSAGEAAAIQRDTRGYPIGLELICRRLAGGAAYTPEILNGARRELFVYYEDAVFRRFDAPLRELLLCLAPFGHFTLELAKMVSGDSRAGEWLGILQRDTTMLLADGPDSWHFWPIFAAFLQWEQRQTLSEAEQRSLYDRAALYYELHDELDQALAYYSKAGEENRISDLLVKNAERHPGVGHYREMQDYYFALPREKILRSPALMCGMSMLTALCLDYEASEEWYQELQGYAASLKKTDSAYDSVQGKLAYLDISLPQRGSRGLTRVITDVFRVMREKDLRVPSFSVTSMLPSIMNGGKDFCEWSKRDDLLYAAMRLPVETVLGRDGVGLADCAICESKFEKGEDVSKRLLTLMSRLGEIQTRGTPDMEFAVIGLLARVQISQGKPRAALESIGNLRQKFLDTGQTRFLGNIDAVLCRLRLRLGDMDAVRGWLRDKAPGNETRLWAMWRYQYMTRAEVQLCEGEWDEALLLLARLVPYCDTCGRVMDGIHLRLLTALCLYRKGGADWREPFAAALERCREYRFVWPVAQYGAAVLPLLESQGFARDDGFAAGLMAAARTMTAQYPRFLDRPFQPVEPLSAAELSVLRLVCENLSNQEIGELLHISLSTVKTHVSSILYKLGVSRRGEARAMAEKLHLVERSD